MTSLIITAAILSGCNVQQSVVARQYVAPAYVAPQVLYFVGAPLRVQSMIELEKRTDADYTEFLEFKAWKAGKHAQQQAQAMTSEEVPPPNPEPISFVNQHCAKCHGTATPKGGYYIDGQSGMRPQDITAALRQIVSGEMPKGTQLTREQKNQLLGELLSLEQTQGDEQ